MIIFESLCLNFSQPKTAFLYWQICNKIINFTTQGLITVRDLSEGDYLNDKLSKDIKGIYVQSLDNEDIELNVGDIITEVNREPISNVANFVEHIDQIKKSGRSSILIRVARDNKIIWSTLRFIRQ